MIFSCPATQSARYVLITRYWRLGGSGRGSDMDPGHSYRNERGNVEFDPGKQVRGAHGWDGKNDLSKTVASTEQFKLRSKSNWSTNCARTARKKKRSATNASCFMGWELINLYDTYCGEIMKFTSIFPYKISAEKEQLECPIRSFRYWISSHGSWKLERY